MDIKNQQSGIQCPNGKKLNNRFTNSAKNSGYTSLNNKSGSNFQDRVVSAKEKVGAEKNKCSRIPFFNVGVTGFFILFAFWIMAVKNGFMLRWYDEMSLFEANKLFFQRLLYYPGGLLKYAGTFLTQLFYYPFLGTSVIIILWLILSWLTGVTFGLKKKAYPFTLIIPLVLLISIIQLDEAWLTIKSEGYLFFPTIGCLFAIGSYYLFKKSLEIRGLSFLIAVIILLCYCIAGFYALLAGALCIINYFVAGIKTKSDHGCGKNKRKNRDCCENYIYLTEAIFLIFILIAVPKLYYFYLNGNTVDNEYLFLKGLPVLMMEKFDIYLWMPFIVTTGVLLLYVIIGSFGFKKVNESQFMRWLGIIFCFIMVLWGIKAEKKSEQLRATVLMLSYMDKNEWEKVPYMMSLIHEPANYTMLMLNNIALIKLKGIGKSLDGIKPSNRGGRGSETFTLTAFVNVPAYYYNGYLNQSYRWAMEHTVQYGKRVFFLKYMVKDALLRGEIKLAKRYNDILLSTMFHRKWAEEINKYIEDPSLITSNKEFSDILRIINEQ